MAVLLVTVMMSAFTLILCQGAVTNQASQNQVSLKESVRESSILGQVLKEYLTAIETVEATGSPCVQDHRTRLSRAQSTLRAQLDKCGLSSGQKEALERCLESSTKGVVSDVRLQIVDLKECVDKC